jgi:hypothetical protein
MILFGGYAGEARSDTWELDLSLADPRWKPLATLGATPPARWAHSAVYDSRRNGMVVFGGADGSGLNPTPRSDTWLLSFADCDAWVPLPLAGSPPLARYDHGAVYDPIADRMIVIGGRDRTGSRFEFTSLEFGTPSLWTAFLPGGSTYPTDRGVSLIYDARDDRLLLIGQNSSGRVLENAWHRTPVVLDDPAPVSGAFRILGVGPNPTRGDVNIAFELPRATTVATRLYDVRGRMVRDLGTTLYQPGPHILCWDGRAASGERLRDGVYFARIVVEGKAIAGKIVLMD